jgi:hypothetical protein
VADPTPPGRFAQKPSRLRPWSRPRPVEEGPEQGAGGGGTFAALLIVAVLLAALLAAFAGVRILGPDDSGDDTEAQATRTNVEHVPSEPEDELRSAPGFRIHPQRAEAGPPLELQVTGEGCPGSSGTLSITEIGTATEVGGPDRLVVRRRFDVDGTRHFRVTPLLVDQPPGSYRVVAACERTATAQPIDDVGRRDVFTMSEVLELTGHPGAREFQVVPSTARPGLATRLALSGGSCVGPAARAQVSIFAPNTGTPPAPATLELPATSGAWQGAYDISADAANGTYTVHARCSNADGVQFDYVTRHVRFADPDTTPKLPSLADIFAPPAKTTPPAKATPPASSRAVEGQPTFTG